MSLLVLKRYKMDDTNWEQRAFAGFGISRVQPLDSATTDLIWVK
jgi:hypothetical protein